jgi:hypothetical protein
MPSCAHGWERPDVTHEPLTDPTGRPREAVHELATHEPLTDLTGRPHEAVHELATQ